MRRLVRYTYKGVSLPLVGWAKRLGTTPKVLEARLISGWSVRKTLSTPLAPNERPKEPPVPYCPPRTSYILEGDGRFMTVKAWADELKCKKHIIYYCLRYNRPFKCPDGKLIIFKRHQAFEHDGIALRACEWAERLNITPARFLQRVRERLDEEKVFEMYQPGRSKKSPEEVRAAHVRQRARQKARSTQKGVAEGVDVVLNVLGTLFD